MNNIIGRSEAQLRYMSDPSFHAVVDCMRSMLANNTIDVASLMVAAVEAANMHAMYNALPVYVVIQKEKP